MSFFFFFNDTATTEIYTLSLHDALPIWYGYSMCAVNRNGRPARSPTPTGGRSITFVSPRRKSMHHYRWRHERDRKSTRLNSSHTVISYAVFCLKKKKSRAGQYYFHYYTI